MTFIYYTHFELPLQHEALYRYINSFPEFLKIKILNFNGWRDIHASLFGKLLLRTALKELGIDCNWSNLKYSQFGRPYFDGMPDFNISHSGEYVICALSTSLQIGIDIEQIIPVKVSMFESIFTEEEWENIRIAKDGCEAFYHYWTAKESIAKAEGRGIGMPLKRIEVRDETGILDGRIWHLKNISISKNYVVQLASSEKSKGIVVKEVYFEK